MNEHMKKLPPALLGVMVYCRTWEGEQMRLLSAGATSFALMMILALDIMT